MGACSFPLFIKFLLFYFQVYKQVMECQFSVNSTIILDILRHYSTKISEASDGKLDKRTFRNLEEVIEEFTRINTMLLRKFADKFVEIVQLKGYQGVSISQFRKFDQVFDIVLEFFRTNFPRLA